MRRLAVLTLTLTSLFGAASAAQALTTREIIELSKAGLGEEVLLALIEVDRGVYAIDPGSMKALKEARVSERVILALVRSGREPLPAPEPPELAEAPAEPTRPEPQVVVIEHREPEVVREVVPVYVAVGSGHVRPRRHVPAATQEPFIPFQSGPPVIRPVTPQPKEPVYWGFGGKLRPDAWKPDNHKSDRRDDRDGDRGRDKSGKK
jgi:hypothetical protein